MKYLELKKIVSEEQNQVFLLNSRCAFPLWFVKHHYFLVSKKGELTRYEIAFEKNKKQKELGHLHINTREPLEGINVFLGINWKWKTQLVNQVEGKTADKLIKILEKTPEEYVDKNNYRLISCNCNTFAQRIINQVPESKFKLAKKLIKTKK